jgi:hypothetical protein
MDPYQTVRMRRLVWIYAGRKHTILVLSWHGSNSDPWYIDLHDDTHFTKSYIDFYADLNEWQISFHIHINYFDQFKVH